MGRMVTLDYVKKHSRIDYNLEDDILEEYIESSEDTVLHMTNRTLESIVEEYGKIPADIKHAVLMLVDHAYQYRSPITSQNLYVVPYTFDAKIKPYMIL